MNVSHSSTLRELKEIKKIKEIKTFELITDY
jgi:hypothetical protein